MTPADPLDTSAVRSTPRPAAPDAPSPRRGLDTSRLVVLGFVLLFVLGTLAFLASVLNTVEREGAPSPPPTNAAVVGAAVPADLPAETVLQQASMTPVGSAAPTVAVPPDASPAAPACPEPSPAASAASAAPSTPPGPSIVPPPSPSPSLPPIASAAPDSSLEPVPSATACDPAIAETSLQRVPFVPVIRYWEAAESISTTRLKAALRGKSSEWPRVLISKGDRAALQSALDIVIDESVREASPSAIIAAVKKGKTLGILRASDVQPSVRALGIDGRALFGNDRVGRIARWPLVAQVETPPDAAWDQGSTWTIAAGGDSFTDRGVYERVVRRKKGVDYPFAGGSARVTGHYICNACPRANGNSIPRYVLSGPKGVLRSLVKEADLAIVNHEQPTPTNWRFHKQKTTFSGKPELTEIFTRAGIDWMSLANNHIRDYQSPGVLNTLKTLDKYGIKHGGAGKNLKQAAKPSYLKVKGQTVAIVACVAVAPASWATDTLAGGLPCKSRQAFAAIRQARKKADVLIVFPHWGVEYTRARVATQEQLAERWANMGVDLVIGAHSHIPGGVADIDGTPVFYSLGNFIFDQNWSTDTAEGVLLELTWHADRLVQARLHPFLTVDQAQPNLLDPARDDGAALIKAIRNASKAISDW